MSKRGLGLLSFLALIAIIIVAVAASGYYLIIYLSSNTIPVRGGAFSIQSANLVSAANESETSVTVFNMGPAKILQVNFSISSVSPPDMIETHAVDLSANP